METFAEARAESSEEVDVGSHGAQGRIGGNFSGIHEFDIRADGDRARLDEPIAAREIAEFGKLEIEEDDTIRIQPCVSPVWDTAIALTALAEAGLPPNHPAMVKAADWLLHKQITNGGDWQIKNRDAEPGGWAFEFRNDWYPDVDDTGFVLIALQRVDFPDRARMHEAVRRGEDGC